MYHCVRLDVYFIRYCIHLKTGDDEVHARRKAQRENVGEKAKKGKTLSSDKYPQKWTADLSDN